MLKHRKLLILLGIGIIGVIVIQLPLLDWLEELLRWVDDHRRIAWLAFIASYVVATTARAQRAVVANTLRHRSVQ